MHEAISGHPLVMLQLWSSLEQPVHKHSSHPSDAQARQRASKLESVALDSQALVGPPAVAAPAAEPPLWLPPSAVPAPPNAVGAPPEAGAEPANAVVAPPVLPPAPDATPPAAAPASAVEVGEAAFEPQLETSAARRRTTRGPRIIVSLRSKFDAASGFALLVGFVAVGTADQGSRAQTGLNS